MYSLTGLLLLTHTYLKSGEVDLITLISWFVITLQYGGHINQGSNEQRPKHHSQFSFVYGYC